MNAGHNLPPNHVDPAQIVPGFGELDPAQQQPQPADPNQGTPDPNVQAPNQQGAPDPNAAPTPGNVDPQAGEPAQESRFARLRQAARGLGASALLSVKKSISETAENRANKIDKELREREAKLQLPPEVKRIADLLEKKDYTQSDGSIIKMSKIDIIKALAGDAAVARAKKTAPKARKKSPTDPDVYLVGLDYFDKARKSAESQVTIEMDHGPNPYYRGPAVTPNVPERLIRKHTEAEAEKIVEKAAAELEEKRKDGIDDRTLSIITRKSGPAEHRKEKLEKKLGHAKWATGVWSGGATPHHSGHVGEQHGGHHHVPTKQEKLTSADWQKHWNTSEEEGGWGQNPSIAPEPVLKLDKRTYDAARLKSEEKDDIEYHAVTVKKNRKKLYEKIADKFKPPTPPNP